MASAWLVRLAARHDPRLVSVLLFLACGPLASGRGQERIATPGSEYTAVVQADRAEFTFPASSQDEWSWYRATTLPSSLEFAWSVRVTRDDHGELRGYEFGAYLFKFPGAKPAKGSLADLLGRMQREVVRVSGKRWGFLSWSNHAPIGQCESRVARGQVTVTLTNPYLIRRIFAQRPSHVAMTVMSPASHQTRDVEVAYQNWPDQPESVARDRPTESSPEALAFLREKADQAMYNIERHGAANATLTATLPTSERGLVKLVESWTKEPVRVSGPLLSKPLSGVLQSDDAEALRLGMLSWMLLSHSTIAVPFVVTSSNDGDLVKITVWSRDLSKPDPVSHFWYEPTGKIVKQLMVLDLETGPYEVKREFTLERLPGEPAEYCIAEVNGSPVEYEFKDGFHRVTAVWDMDHVSRLHVEIGREQ